MYRFIKVFMSFWAKRSGAEESIKIKPYKTTPNRYFDFVTIVTSLNMT